MPSHVHWLLQPMAMIWSQPHERRELKPLVMLLSDTKINKTYFDAYYSIRMTLKLGCIALTGGYFYWAPKWEFGKDYKVDGFCIGLMYSTKR